MHKPAGILFEGSKNTSSKRHVVNKNRTSPIPYPSAILDPFQERSLAMEAIKETIKTLDTLRVAS